MGLFGKSDSERSLDYQREQVDHQFNSNLQDYYWQWNRPGVSSEESGITDYEAHVGSGHVEGDWRPGQGQQWKLYDFQKETVEKQRANSKAERDYAIETANKNYVYGLKVADYEFKREQELVAKRNTEVNTQKSLNQTGMEYALERERRVLDEEFLQAAFNNASLIQDLYEATGATGYQKAALQLGLKDVEGGIEGQKAKKLTNVKQEAVQSKFKTANTQLGMVDAAGKAGYTKDALSQNLRAQEAQSKFDQYKLGIDIFESKTRADFENDMLTRQIDDQKAKAAFDTTESNIKALQAAGKAQLGQTGRSQAKAIQNILAEVGRQNAYLVETLMRGKATADVQARQTKVGALGQEARSVIESDKIDLKTLDNLATTDREFKEVNRGLSLTGQKGELDLEAIRVDMLNLLENTNLDFQELNRNMRTSQIKSALDLQRADWDLDNTGARFRSNQTMIKEMLESATSESVANQKDIVLGKLGADLQAEASRFLDPVKQPDLLNPADNLPPIIEYQDPLAPEPPPEPVKGAVPTGSSSAARMANAALGGATAGLGAYATAATGLQAAGMATTAAGPIGWAVGIGTTLMSL
tara:strand:- start:7871 stop:9628 length:1758 start_codon:yes stop_codon:yes gene_type:complete